MKIRGNPFFPASVKELAVSLGMYWRELATAVNGKGELRESNEWHASNAGAYKVLTSASTSIAIDLAESNNFRHTLTENTTLAAPTNPTPGQAGVIQFNQHSSSPKTISFNAFWRWPGGTDGALTATNSAVDVMSYVVDSSAAFATCVMLNDIK